MTIVTTKRRAEIHATNLQTDLIVLMSLVGGKPGSETDEADARLRLINRCVSHLTSLIRSVIEEHRHADPRHLSVETSGPVTWIVPSTTDGTVTVSGSQTEPSEPADGHEHTRSHIEPGEKDGRGIHAVIPSRPGKSVPTAEWVCERAAEALAEAGFPGHSPLGIVSGIQAMSRAHQLTHQQLLTAQASARQHLEASSHRAQIAEHYRAALLQVVEGPAESWSVWRGVARDALQAPEWDRKIRP